MLVFTADVTESVRGVGGCFEGHGVHGGCELMLM
jgi:hypothetical protein